MFVETAAPSPAFFSGLVPEEVTLPRHDFSALTADNLSRTLLAEVRPAVIVCGAMWAEAYRRQIDELVAIRKSARDRFGFYTLDVLREEELTGWVQVRVLPTTLIVRQNRIVTRFAGVTSRRVVRSALTAAAFPAFR